MKRLRFVIVPGKDVQEGECYLMAAIPTVIKETGTGPNLIGQRQLNMNMVPCRLEWVDMDTEEATQIHLEEIAPPIVMPPTGKQDG